MTDERLRYRCEDPSEIVGDWQDPRVTGRNKLPGRFLSLPFVGTGGALDVKGAGESSVEGAPEGRGAGKTASVGASGPEGAGGGRSRVLSLDGDWKFRWAPSPAAAPPDWPAEDCDDCTWPSVPVPGNWEMHGHGIPQYNNVVYPYSHDVKNPPAINPNDNPTGVYRTTVDIPESWTDRLGTAILRFEGIRSAADVAVNGRNAGYTQDSYSPAEFAVGSLLRPGRNLIAVRVYKWCAGTYLEDQDMWRMAGIFRSVVLFLQPEGGIEDVFARCRFDAAFRNAELTVTVKLGAAPLSPETRRTVRWYIYEPGGEDIVASSGEAAAAVGPDEGTAVDLAVTVADPRKWSAEDPFLYRLRVEAVGGDGEADVRTLDWGFRQVDIVRGEEGAELRVNGARVKLRGVNRHDIHPRFGQAVPREVIESDLILMKRHNINALRCSHYPNPEALYRIADRLGLYVIDEANVESHGLRHRLPASRPEWTANCVERMERLVLTHRNHPCIIFWSLGNEAGQGKNFKEMKRAALALDATRPIHYEGDHRLDTSDVFSLMYPGVGTVDRIGRGRIVRVAPGERGKPMGWRVRPRQYRDRPFLLCEFAHAMGNSLGNFSDYMEVIEKHPRIAGAFIWNFSDQALYRDFGEAGEQLAYGGDFGESPHDGIFCADGIFTADRKPQPEAAEVKALYAPIAVEADDLAAGRVFLTNRHAHIDLSAYRLDWVLERNGFAVAEGTVLKPEIRPGERRLVNLYRDLAAFPGEGEGFLTFALTLREATDWAPAGYEVARLQVPVPAAADRPLPRDAIFSHLEGRPSEDVGALSGVAAREENGRSRTDIAGKETAGPGTVPPVEWKHGEVEGRLVVAGAGLGARIRLDDGALEALDFGRGSVLAAPLGPDFFRAPTDNEQLGAAAFLDEFLGPGPLADGLRGLAHRMADSAYGRGWEGAARDRTAKPPRLKKGADGFTVSFRLAVRGFLGRLRQEFLFRNDGTLGIRLKGVPTREMVRFGTRLALPARFREVTWYGLGPQECYADRKSGACVGLYAADAGLLSHRYLMPQESGNRTGVRWVSFSDGPFAVTFSAAQGRTVDFSAHFADRESIAEAHHDFELEDTDALHIHVDAGQRGVGGSVPGILALLPKYRMKAFRRYRLEFTVSPGKPRADGAKRIT